MDGIFLVPSNLVIGLVLTAFIIGFNVRQVIDAIRAIMEV